MSIVAPDKRNVSLTQPKIRTHRKDRLISINTQSCKFTGEEGEQRPQEWTDVGNSVTMKEWRTTMTVKVHFTNPSRYTLPPRQDILYHPFKIYSTTPSRYTLPPIQDILYHHVKIYSTTPSRYTLPPRQDVLYHSVKVYFAVQ